MEKYELGEILVKTANSTIQEATLKDGDEEDFEEFNKDFIIKRLDASRHNNLNMLRREILIMNSVNHTNLLNYDECFIYEEELCLVMPRFSCGLNDLVGPPVRRGIKDKVLISNIFYYVLQGIKYLHDRKIVHRDIKGGNILLNPDGQLVVTDFGVSIDCLNKNATSFVGTPCWMSPEMCECENLKSYDYKTDIWSIGITFLEVYNGRAPYIEFPPMKVIKLIYTNPPPVPDRAEVGGHKTIVEFLTACLQKDPNKRADCNQLLDLKLIKSKRKDMKYFTTEIKKLIDARDILYKNKFV
tara:strand:- start:3433 stop:4329 length:897 start_codon:yes stop_codon:yes gene_type:complete